MPDVQTRGGPPLAYSIVAGVTPCPKGWLAASAKLSGATFAPEDARVYGTLIELMDERPPFSIIALNAPIGYLDEARVGGRTCDRQARALLGAHRGAAVHSAPSRVILEAEFEDGASHLDAISRMLLPRFREVEAEMAPYLQRTIYEVHPEMSFYQINGDHPLHWSKRGEAGTAERRALLEKRIPGIQRVLDARIRGVRPSHLLDAAALLWTSRRIAARAATRLPTDPEWDSQGLRMEIMR